MPAAGGLDAERDREVRLAGADRPGDDDVGGALDVLAGRELCELWPLDAPQRLPVELLERLEVREPRLTQQLTGSVPAALGDLPGLDSLWLNGNTLTGCIPDAPPLVSGYRLDAGLAPREGGEVIRAVDLDGISEPQFVAVVSPSVILDVKDK